MRDRLQSGQGPLDNLIEVRLDLADLKPLPQHAQFVDQRVEMIHAFGQSPRGVLAERRVVKVDGHVLQQQG